MEKRLYRSTKDKYLAGVCGGLAEYFAIDATIIRVTVFIIGVSSFGSGVMPILLIYLVAALVIPKRPIEDDYRDSEYNEQESVEKDANKVSNTKQTFGFILVGAGALILLSHLIDWFDSSMILAMMIIAFGVALLFKKDNQ